MAGVMDTSHVNVLHCDWPIPRPERSYRMCVFVCVAECDQVQQ